MRLVIWFCLITFVEWFLPGGQRRAAEASGAAVGVSWCLGRGRLGCSCFADRGGFRGHGSWERGANTPSTRGATNSDPGEGEGGISGPRKGGTREGGWGDGKGGTREGGTNSGSRQRSRPRRRISVQSSLLSLFTVLTLLRIWKPQRLDLESVF